MKMNLFKSKRFVLTLTLTMCCVAFSVLILGLAIAFNKAPNKKNASAQYIYGNNSIVKLEVVDDITLEDDTIETLQPKIKVTSTGTQGEFGALVKVTPQNVVFDYTLDNTKHSFATMGKDITIDDGSGSGGSGSTTITIPDKSRLGNIREDVNNGNPYKDCTIKLSNDLDLLGEEWTPIGTQANPFQGTFDGQKHTISNFNVTTTSAGFYAGFFGVVLEGAIENLNISNATISSTSFYTGILCGALASEGTNAFAKNCSVDSSCKIVAEAGLFVGGMFGITSGATVEECSSSAQVTLSSMSVTVGGLIGGSEYKVINCSSQANINIIEAKTSENEAECIIGGIVGQAGGVIDKCLFNGKINIEAKSRIRRFQVAGIAGNVYVSISIKNSIANISDITTNVSDNTTYFNLIMVQPIHGGHYYVEEHTQESKDNVVGITWISIDSTYYKTARTSGEYGTKTKTTELYTAPGGTKISETNEDLETIAVSIICEKVYYLGSTSSITDMDNEMAGIKMPVT